jgi:hypothetical protein
MRTAPNDHNEVLKAFLDFRIVLFEDVEATPDWNREDKIRLNGSWRRSPQNDRLRFPALVYG